MKSFSPFGKLLQDKQVVVLVGRGGVGKTTVAAALGLQGALLGKRTLVATVDPAQRLANALGFDSFTQDIQQIDPAHLAVAGLTLKAPLYAMMLDIKRVSDEVIETHTPDAQRSASIRAHPLYRHASASVAGTHDYMALELLLRLHDDPKYDLIILDTPPFDYTVGILDAPHRLEKGVQGDKLERFLRPFVRHLAGKDEGPFQDKKSPSLGMDLMALAGKGISRVVTGITRFSGVEALREVMQFVISVSHVLAGMKARSLKALELLKGPSCAFLVLAGAGPTALGDALWLQERLFRRGLPLGGFIVNRIRHLPSDFKPCSIPSEQELLRHLERERERISLAIGGDINDFEACVKALRVLVDEAVEADRFDHHTLEQLTRVLGADIPVGAVHQDQMEVHSMEGLFRLGTQLVVQ